MKLIRLRIWLSKRMDYKEGEQSFIANLYLYEITQYLPASHGASGLQAFH
jgi:hypothetical protein